MRKLETVSVMLARVSHVHTEPGDNYATADTRNTRPMKCSESASETVNKSFHREFRDTMKSWTSSRTTATQVLPESTATSEINDLRSDVKGLTVSGGGKNTHFDHYEPTVRMLNIRKTVTGECGFHLTRTKWDPYPWVSAVDAHTPAEMSGLQAGDCVLEVNGENVLGLRITDIAKLVKAKSGHVTLVLWSSGCDVTCDPESLCCGPMPRSLQRLSVIVQSILTIIECPVCLDTIPPPALQCQNGHLLCVNCRIRAEKCPVCRDRYTPQRALIAEQIYTTITNAFQLCNNEDKLRQKVFGLKAKQPNSRITPEPVATKKHQSAHPPQTNQHVAQGLGKAGRYSATKIDADETNLVGGVGAAAEMGKRKFLMKLLRGRAYSMENLSISRAAAPTSSRTLLLGTSTPTLCAATATVPASGATPALSQMSPNPLVVDDEDNANDLKNHLTFPYDNGARSGAKAIKTKNRLPATTNTTTINDVAQVAAMPERFSLSNNDLSQTSEQRQRLQQQTTKWQQCERHSASDRHTTSNATDALASPPLERCPASVASHDCNISTSNSPTPNAKSSPCRSPSTSIEHIQTPDVDDDRASMATNKSGVCRAPQPPASSMSSGVSTAESTSSPTSLPPAVLVLSAATIKNELLSLSATSRAHSAGSASLPSPNAAPSDELPAATMAPVGVVLPYRATDRPRESSSSLLSTVALQAPPTMHLSERSHNSRSPFRCPCYCESHFETSSQLQRHVRVQHRLPVVSFGSTSAQLALPLRQPLDNAVLILEIPNNGSDGGGGNNNGVDSVGGTDACQAGQPGGHQRSGEKGDDKGCSKAAPLDEQQQEYKECWIRIKMHGDCIHVTALLQAASAENLDFVMETRLSGRTSISLLVKSAAQNNVERLRLT